MNLMKVKICTIVAILLDILALAIIGWMGAQAASIVLWICLAIFGACFVFDMANAIRFYKNIRRNK